VEVAHQSHPAPLLKTLQLRGFGDRHARRVRAPGPGEALRARGDVPADELRVLLAYCDDDIRARVYARLARLHVRVRGEGQVGVLLKIGEEAPRASAVRVVREDDDSCLGARGADGVLVALEDVGREPVPGLEERAPFQDNRMRETVTSETSGVRSVLMHLVCRSRIALNKRTDGKRRRCKIHKQRASLNGSYENLGLAQTSEVFRDAVR
jgi:hypothetical protein